jgi:two-component system sensor histidine kinase/response regulator
MTHLHPNRRTLLVVDDQEENLRMLAAILTMMGYDLVPAFNGSQALQRLAARLPDLILLDIVLPDIDGVALCRQIKENPAWADIPIIFVSASDDKNLVVQALETGGVDYVTKPYNKAELISRVRAHLALKESRDALRDLAADKDALLGMLAHDFKNHLSGVMVSSRLLAGRDGAFDPRSRELLDEIAHSSERMLAFIQRFLTNQKATFSAAAPEPFDVGAVILQAVRQHFDHAAMKGITIHCEMPDSGLHGMGDANALRQIVDNLVSNAVKFTPEDGSVHVAAAEAGGRITIDVRDTGPGFSNADLPRLYERYARLSATATGGELSSGLGLSIARRLAVQMGASLDLVSPADAAAHFRIVLPVAPPPAAPEV